MGGYSGEVRGKKKWQCYEKYKEKAEGWPCDHDPPPHLKKVCYKKMVWDEASEKWVLHFRFEK